MTAARPSLPPLPYRVAERSDETPDTAELVLDPVAEALSPFVPGQFAMVYAFGIGDIPLSLSRLDGSRLTHTVRAVGAVSRALHALPRGATVGIRGPFGTGWELPSAQGLDLLVIAGGLGLAPLRPLVRAALATPRLYGRLTVLIGTRTPDDLLFCRDVDDWRGAGAQVHVTVDRPDGDWQGEVGVVTALLDRAEFTPGRAAAFVCGPEVMMRATARELVHRGLVPDRVRVSLERTMHCGTGHCGHCQLGPLLLCRDGPVVPWSRAEHLLSVREL
ncbi:FAD/NAD(P)-binding protein [Streptomyces sp. NPDC052052]|uniref:FAD/NAD(P)-binding protein n=1 Tax=Streptomyces sp. NPDC052052 TaxID=3154756 RepID=UPI0034219A80